MDSVLNGSNTGRGGRRYSKEATAYFALIPDMPEFFKEAWDKRVKALKKNGTWNEIKQLLVFPYTLSMFNGFIDAKTLRNTISLVNVAQAPLVDPYSTPAVYVGNQGCNFYKGSLQTNFIPANNLVLNNTCFAAGFPAKSNAISGQPILANQGSTQIIQINPNDAFNKSIFDSYGSGTGGRISETSTDGALGVYIANRRTISEFKGWKNGVVVASTTSNSGTLPTIQIVFNVSSRNEPIAFWCAYGTGLTNEQVLQESRDWSTFLSEIKRNIEPTKVFLTDGNSHSTYWLAVFGRTIEWNYMNAGDFNWKYWHVGVAGQTIQNMNSDYLTEVSPLLSPATTTYTKKIVCVFGEPTNAIEAGTAMATIQTDYAAYCASARASGAKVIVHPLFVRNYSSVQKCLDADTWNTWIEANWSTFADAYVPHPTYYDDISGTFKTNYWLPRSASTSDSQYKTDLINFAQARTNYFYQGTLHLTEFGYQEWANDFYKASLTL